MQIPKKAWKKKKVSSLLSKDVQACVCRGSERLPLAEGLSQKLPSSPSSETLGWSASPSPGWLLVSDANRYRGSPQKPGKAGARRAGTADAAAGAAARHASRVRRRGRSGIGSGPTHPAARGAAEKRWESGAGDAPDPFRSGQRSGWKNAAENIFPANKRVVCKQRDQPRFIHVAERYPTRAAAPP